MEAQSTYPNLYINSFFINIRMPYQSSNYLRTNLGSSFTAAEYLDLINSPQFATFVNQDFQAVQTWQAADTFFELHTSFIHPFAFSGHSIAGIELWMNLLERLQQINPSEFDRIHKGTPYYHAGIYSLFATKYTEAFEWFGYAFEQCIRTGRIPDPGTPSQWILTFDTREGHRQRGADYGTTQKLLTEVESLIQNIYLHDSRFIITHSSLRDIVRSNIVINGSTRALRSAWADFLAILMSHNYVKKIIRIAPNQEEAQLSAHNNLSRLTLILEALIKEIPNYSRSVNVNQNSQLGDLLQHIIAPEYGYSYNSGNCFVTNQIRKNYSHILNDIRSAEVSNDKLAVAFTVAQRIRNYSHHLFNDEYISEETFENIYLRIIYCILSIIIKFYV